MLDGFGKGALGLAAGVGQGEDNGALVKLGHAFEDLGGEGATDGAEAHENGWLDVLDNLLEGLVLLALVVISGEVKLVLGELVTTVVGNKTLGVDEPEAASCLVLGQSLPDEELDNLLGNTDTCRASTKEDGTLIGGGSAGLLDSVDETSEDNSTGTLDVVVECAVCVLVALQSGEGVLEILELDNDSRPPLGQSSHELVEELTLLVGSNLLASASQVQRVLNEGLVGGSEIEHKWKSCLWADAGACSVKCELANGDTHAVDSKVTKTEDTRAVSYDGNLNIVLPVLKDRGNAALV